METRINNEEFYDKFPSEILGLLTALFFYILLLTDNNMIKGVLKGIVNFNKEEIHSFNYGMILGFLLSIMIVTLYIIFHYGRKFWTQLKLEQFLEGFGVGLLFIPFVLIILATSIRLIYGFWYIILAILGMITLYYIRKMIINSKTYP
jgi:hypothetical protein